MERERGGKGDFISVEGRLVGALCSPSVPFFMSLKLCPKTISKILLCQMNGFRYSPEYCTRLDYLARIAGVYSLILRNLQLSQLSHYSLYQKDYLTVVIVQ